MKAKLARSVGVSTLVVAMATVSPALAFDMNLLNPYVEFGGGANFQSFTLDNLNPDSTNPPATSTEINNLGIGADIYAAIGAEIVPGLRGELLGSFHTNSGAEFDIFAEGSASIVADTQTLLLLANLWKDFEVSQGVVVSVGGGLGFGSTMHTATSGAFTTETTTTGLGFMAGAGVGFDVGSGMILNLTYSVSGIAGGATSTNDIDSDESDDEPFTADLTSSLNQAVTVGLRIPIGN